MHGNNGSNAHCTRLRRGKAVVRGKTMLTGPKSTHQRLYQHKRWAKFHKSLQPVPSKAASHGCCSVTAVAVSIHDYWKINMRAAAWSVRVGLSTGPRSVRTSLPYSLGLDFTDVSLIISSRLTVRVSCRRLDLSPACLIVQRGSGIIEASPHALPVPVFLQCR